MKKIKFIAIMLLTLITCNIFAWWDLGHFLTATVARNNLSPQAVSEVDNCLVYPIAYPPKPSKDFSPANMVNCATWLDNIKGGKWNSNADKEKFSNIHFSDMFYNISSPLDDYSSAYEKVLDERSLTKYNSLQAAESSIKSLVSTTSKAEKAVAMKTLIHVIGDIHCPMHSIDPTIDDVGTRGGNDIKFSKADGIVFYDTNNGPNEITNMHKLWDGMGGAYLNLPYPVLNVDYPYLNGRAEDLASLYSTLDDGKADLNDWAALTLIIGEKGTIDKVVTYPVSDMSYSKINDYKGFYSEFAKENCKKQIYLGGKRLAGILMAIYDPANAQKKYIDLVNKIQFDSNVPTLQEYMEFQFR